MSTLSQEEAKLASTLLDADIVAVRETFKRFAWSIDMCRWDETRTYLDEQVEVEIDGVSEYAGADEFILGCQKDSFRLFAQRHFQTDALVTPEGDDLGLFAYTIVQNYRPTANEAYGFAIGRVYASLSKDGACWRIRRLKTEISLREVGIALDAVGPSDAMPTATGDGITGGFSDPTRARVYATADYLQVSERLTRLVYAWDQKKEDDLRRCLTEQSSLQVGEVERHTGLEDVVPALLAIGSSAGQQTHISNVKSATDGARAVWGAYVYRVRAHLGQDQLHDHSGGILVGTAVRGEDGWLIDKMWLRMFWDRQPASGRLIIQELPEAIPHSMDPWSFEGKREPLNDEEEIRSLLMRYTWSYDFCNLPQMRECFAEDVESTHTLDKPMHYSNRDDLMQRLTTNRLKAPYVQHYMANIVVDMGPDRERATVRAYTYTRRIGEGGGRSSAAGGTYHCNVQRVGGQWKFVTFRYSRVFPAWH